MNLSSTKSTAEIGGLLLSYRGADQNVADYMAFGYPTSTPSWTLTTGTVNDTVAGEKTVLALFGNECLNGYEYPPENSSEFTTYFNSLSGFPRLSPRTPYSVFNNFGQLLEASPPFFVADMPLVTPASGATYGPYTVWGSCNTITWSHLVLIPDGAVQNPTSGDPLFFAGEIPAAGGLCSNCSFGSLPLLSPLTTSFLNFNNSSASPFGLFGHYSYSGGGPTGGLNHADLSAGISVTDAQDASNGIYMSSIPGLTGGPYNNPTFYTSPALFPNLYNFVEGDWWWYEPDPNRVGHYTTNPCWFWDFGTSSIPPHWVNGG